MFAGEKTKHYLPWDDDSWIEFQSLTGEQIAQAKTAGLKALMGLMSGMDEKLIKMMREGSEGGGGADADPDGATLLRFAVSDWSDEREVTPAEIAGLDAKTFDWAIEIVKATIERPAGEGSGSEAS